MAGTFDRLGGGDTVLFVWFLREKIAGNRGFVVGIHHLRGKCDKSGEKNGVIKKLRGRNAKGSHK